MSEGHQSPAAPPSTAQPPFLWIHLHETNGLTVESNLGPTQKLAMVKAAETLVMQQVLALMVPKAPAVVKANGLARRIFGR